MELHFGGVDEAIVCRSDVHVEISKRLPSSISWKRVESLYAGSNEVNEVNLVISDALVVRIIQKWVINVRSI